MAPDHPLVAGHKGPVLDIAWCKHNDNVIGEFEILHNSKGQRHIVSEKRANYARFQEVCCCSDVIMSCFSLC